jgi:hypothetical protein
LADSFLDSWTVEAHVRANSFTDGLTNTILAFYDNDSSDRAWVLLAIGTDAAGYYFHWRQWRLGTATPVLTVENHTATGGTGGGAQTDRWYHIAATMDGTLVRIFVDGVPDQTATSAAIHDAGRGLDIGGQFLASTYDRFWDGWIDNIRITKGVARYRRGFVPPTGPYPTS